MVDVLLVLFKIIYFSMEYAKIHFALTLQPTIALLAEIIL